MNQHQVDLTDYLSAFITGLVEMGVSDVVISPGSRSTPLAMLFAEHREIRDFVHVDERSAAYFALGIAKSSQRPVVLLCTSGSAAANYYPAVIEANLSNIPLVVLTADRPHELRDVGAPQAIDQNRLYGQHVRWFTEMSLPESSQSNYAKMTARRAVKEALNIRKGPVHVNFPLREPLIPSLEPYPFPDQTDPFPLESGTLHLSEEQLGRLSSRFQEVTKGLIVCGPMEDSNIYTEVIGLAEKLSFPILADPLSQLRSGDESASEWIIDSYDAILKTKEAVEYFKPELIIRFGALPVSKPLALFMKRYEDAEHILIDGQARWRDPAHLGKILIQADEAIFARQLLSLVDAREKTAWLHDWQHVNRLAKEEIEFFMDSQNELEEGKAVYELLEHLPPNSTVFAGNSMPIRDVDSFFHINKNNIKMMANRGANGIDGVVSTALGAAVHQRPLFLLIGDLSFFHDMNGLIAAKLYKLNMTIILLNNEGGGIFSYLPQAGEPKHFERLFGTPLGLNFSHAAQLFQAQYTLILDYEGLGLAIAEAAGNDGLNIIEIPTDRDKNLQSHREMWSRVSREISAFLEGKNLC